MAPQENSNSQQGNDRNQGSGRNDGPPPQDPQQPQGPQQGSRNLWFWWLIMIALLVWNFMAFWPKPHPEAQIPYSTFLSQVRDNNVQKVTISGDTITGTLVKPIKWPPPAASAGTSASPATPEASKSAAQPGTPKADASSKTASKTPSAPPAEYSQFTSTFPQVIGDPSLISLLESHNVTVQAEPPPSHWFTFLLTDGFPLLLLVGFFVWMGRQASRSQSGVFGFSRSKARQYGSDQPVVTFADVAGDDEAKAELEEEVDFLRRPEKYHDLGAKIPRGILLVGPPGTGKTLLARAVAGEAGVPFFSISASEFVEMFVGVGASRVRDLFQRAKASAPAIVFIDELDAVGRRRGAGLGQTNDEREQTLNQLLVEMDGFDLGHEVIVLAATNRPDVLDPALLRPGRFDRQVTVGLPDRQAREGILKIHTRHLRLGSDVNLEILARSTTGFSGADLANLSNEAALLAARRNHQEISMTDFEEAIDKTVLGDVRPKLQDENERRTVAYHESGHALVAWYTPEADPVHKVTIIPHGRALGVTSQLPSEDRYNYSKTYLMSRIAVMLGGRTAEEIVIGDITTGAESDLIQATRLARRMIMRWGMGNLGLTAFKTDDEQPFLGYELTQGREYSEETASRIDKEVQLLLEERHKAAHSILTERRKELDVLVEKLLKGETVKQEELTMLFGPKVSSGPVAKVS